MSINDKKIKSILSTIEDKKNNLGNRPRMLLESNGLIDIVDRRVNINTINDVNECVSLAAVLISRTAAAKEAARFLGVKDYTDKSAEKALRDLRNKVQLIQWLEEEKKLKALEKKLKDLRSEDAKVEDELNDIMAML